MILAPAKAEEVFRLEGHGGPVKAIAVEGDRALTASFDNSVGLWDLEEGQPRWLEGHTAAVNAVVFLPEGGFASAGDDNSLRLWNEAGGERHALEGHTAKIMNLDAVPGMIASASWDGRIGLWSTHDGAHIGWLAGHEGQVNDIAFAQGGTRLFSASYDGTIREWDVARMEELRIVARHGFGINVMALDTKAGWIAYGALDGGTRVVRTDDGAILADLSADRRPILALDRRGDGGEISVGDGEGFIMAVETDGWTIARDFRAAERGPIWALAYSERKSRLFAGGIDDGAQAFDLENSPLTLMASAERSFLMPPEAMSNGERQFKRKCSVCHTLEEDGKRRAGPSLMGLFGRKAGSVAGYTYSDALTGIDLVWTEKTVADLFEIGPDHYLPGTKMPMQRIVRAEDRADLVDYLQTHTRR